MTYANILTDFPLLTEELLNQAFESVKRKLRLPPVLVSATLVNVKDLDLVGVNLTIDSRDGYYVKEVKEVMSETPVYDHTELDITGGQNYSFSFTPKTPTGEVFYNNNQVSAEDAICNILLYIYPSIRTETIGDVTDKIVPQGLVMPIVARAMYYYHTSQYDIASANAWNDLCVKLLNHLLTTAYKLMPHNWCSVSELELYGV